MAAQGLLPREQRALELTLAFFNVSIGDHLAYDTMILGHFHQYLVIPGVIVNGSLKGYDEYAYVSNFGFETPRQAFWVTTPEHGPSFHTAIEVMNRKNEAW